MGGQGGRGTGGEDGKVPETAGGVLQERVEGQVYARGGGLARVCMPFLHQGQWNLWYHQAVEPSTEMLAFAETISLAKNMICGGCKMLLDQLPSGHLEPRTHEPSLITISLWVSETPIYSITALITTPT